MTPPAGYDQENVGLELEPEMVTPLANGAGATPTSDPVVAVAVSTPLVNVKVHGPVRLASKGMLRRNSLGLAVEPANGSV